MNIETERLTLRQWQQDDFEAYANYYAKNETARFVGGVMDRGKAWRHMAALVGHWVLKGFGVWAVEEKTGGKFIGGIGLWEPEGWPELEVGYWLLKEAHGKGYAIEAVTRARDYAYQELGATTLVSYIDPRNEPSKRVAERMGAINERTIELIDCGPHCVYRHLGPEALDGEV